MTAYRAPLRDFRFILYELHGVDRLRALPGCEDIDSDLMESILTEAAKVCEQVLHPLNRAADEAGCQLSGGVVSTPEGFPEAYQRFAEGGWTALSCDPAFGGQGLPHAVRTLVDEMVCSANLAFASYTMLLQGAHSTLSAFGSIDIQKSYLPKIVSGTWMATMCLTEAQCGSDLGLIRTRATPLQGGRYRIKGTKIFVSAGEHDLAENIVHLVLARLPDAPPGTKGISLFAVPKLLPDSEARVGRGNGVTCVGLEKKMGQLAAATCVLEFDDAIGWLVGEPHDGLRAMFAMMNTVRLGAGIQALGIAEAAYQGSAAYARERLQGRAPSGPRYPDKPADPLLVHPDVRRMLLTMRAYTEGMRALGQWMAQTLDERERHPEQAVREKADQLVSLMTPVVKALFTDLGSECANLGIQVLGGHGYIRDHGIEQLVRDVRVTQIYDGTNGIQALDLVKRKLRDERSVQRFFEPTQAFVDENAGKPEMAEFVQPLSDSLSCLRDITSWMIETGASDPDEAAAAASDYLRLFGLVALGFMWTKTAAVALARTDDPDGAAGFDGAFYRAKLRTARHYIQRLLPQTDALAKAITAGGAPILSFDEAAF